MRHKFTTNLKPLHNNKGFYSFHLLIIIIIMPSERLRKSYVNKLTASYKLSRCGK